MADLRQTDCLQEGVDLIAVPIATGISTGAGLFYGAATNFDHYPAGADPLAKLVEAFEKDNTCMKVYGKGPAMMTTGLTITASDLVSLPFSTLYHGLPGLKRYISGVWRAKYPTGEAFYPTGMPGGEREVGDAFARVIFTIRSAKKAVMNPYRWNIKREYDPVDDPLVAHIKEYGPRDTFLKRRLNGPGLVFTGAVQTGASVVTGVGRLLMEGCKQIASSHKSCNGRLPDRGDYQPVFVTAGDRLIEGEGHVIDDQ